MGLFNRRHPIYGHSQSEERMGTVSATSLKPTSLPSTTISTPELNAHLMPHHATSPAYLDGREAVVLDRFSKVEDSWSRKTLLTLDGGGIRGLSSLFILQYLMKEIKEIEEHHGVDCSAHSALSRDPANLDLEKFHGTFRPCHYFDYIAGTSTGGITAIMLGRMQCTVEETILSYQVLWKGMADISPSRILLNPGKTKSHNAQGLEKSLRSILGSEAPNLGSDPKMCRTFVLAMEKSEVGYRTPYLFRSYPFIKTGSNGFNRNPDKRTDNVNLVDVCRATSAAPQYFGSLRLEKSKFQDGSRWTINPSLEAYREISSMHYAKDNPNPIFYMLSVGCGERKLSRRGSPFSFRNNLALRTSREDEAVEQMMQEMSLNAEFAYCRLSGSNTLPNLEENKWKSDPQGKKTFEEIEQAAQTYCKQHHEKIREAAKELVEIRQRRANTAQWEEFAFGYQYICTICEHDGITSTGAFDHRADFVDHLRRRHHKPPETEEFLPELRRIIHESRKNNLFR